MPLRVLHYFPQVSFKYPTADKKLGVKSFGVGFYPKHKKPICTEIGGHTLPHIMRIRIREIIRT